MRILIATDTYHPDVRALPLLVRDGANGRLSTPGDVPGLVSALTRILTDDSLRTRMGNESMRLVADLGVAAEPGVELMA